MNENFPWMTLQMCLLAVVFSVVGGIVSIVDPDQLPFETYLDRMGELALAVSALGVGRSLRKGLAGEGQGGAAGLLVEKKSLNDRPLMTITLGTIVLVAAGTGGALVIAGSTDLKFDDYLDKMNLFAFAIGAQGAGRAVRKGLENRGGAASLGEFAAHPDHPANALNLGIAQPAPAAGDTFFNVPLPAPLGAVNPDEDLGADEDDLGDDVDEELGDGTAAAGDLPSDEEEFSSPPPDDLEPIVITDEHLLDQPGVPNVLMPPAGNGS
jgi:hypothetical protein